MQLANNLSEQIFMLYFVEQCEEAPLCLVELFTSRNVIFDLTGHVSPEENVKNINCLCALPAN